MITSVITHGDPDTPLVVVMLHGRDMQGADLAPFAQSLGVSAHYVFPDAPNRRWWSSPDALAERAAARAWLAELLAPFSDRTLALVGFSQGGMLALDYLVAGGKPPAALALLSSKQLDWPAPPALAGVRALVAHGTQDAELPFAEGEALRDFVQRAGADTTWLPFDGPHEIPLVVWRALRKLLRSV